MNQEENKSKFQETKEHFQQMKTVPVKHNSKWDGNLLHIYTNEYASSHKYFKQNDNTYMVIMRNNGAVIDVNICTFDPFQHISSHHRVLSDQHLPMNCFYCIGVNQ